MGSPCSVLRSLASRRWLRLQRAFALQPFVAFFAQHKPPAVRQSLLPGEEQPVAVPPKITIDMNTARIAVAISRCRVVKRKPLKSSKRDRVGLAGGVKGFQLGGTDFGFLHLPSRHVAWRVPGFRDRHLRVPTRSRRHRRRRGLAIIGLVTVPPIKLPSIVDFCAIQAASGLAVVKRQSLPGCYC